jgi:hypothetical protein
MLNNFIQVILLVMDNKKMTIAALEYAIGVLQRELGQLRETPPSATPEGDVPVKKRGTISPEGIERIRAAAKARWAAKRKAAAAVAKRGRG